MTFDTTNFHLLLYPYYTSIVIICLIIIFNTRTPSKALSYIFLVTIFPIFGAVLYFAVGFNYRKRKMYDKKIAIDTNSYPQLAEKITNFSKDSIHRFKEDLGYFYPLVSSKKRKDLISNNNGVELLINGENKFPKVLESLKAATHHIHIEYYIYANDDIGKAIAKILKEKARNGVKVRFLYDDFGSIGIRKSFVRELREAGVETSAFYKINFIHFANRINYRDHRKIIVIDGEVGYVGGINIADSYINNGKNELYWRDTHIKLSGPVVANLQYLFLTDWNFCSSQNIAFSSVLFPLKTLVKHTGNKTVQIVASGPDSDHPSIMYSYIQAIMLAREEILLTTPYFIPDKAFIDAIKIAALTGVKIKILIPGISDSLFVNAISNSNYEELLEIGIEIYKYNKGFVHAKTAVFDRRVAFVGTSNLDNRSFDLNFEVNAIIYNRDISVELTDTFYNDLESSTLITLTDWQNRPFHKNMFEKTARLFSPLV